MIRRAVVAGSFYPGSKATLQRELEQYISPNPNKQKVIGLICPHAGYIYSGGCAGKGFSRVEVPGNVIILGVNHHGIGHPYAIDGNGSWSTPLGEIQLNTEMREKLVENSEVFAIDSTAGSREHSLEVQVPFIQYLNPKARILPITISCINPDELTAGGKEIARFLQSNPDLLKDTLIVASTDMSHYISAQNAKQKDDKAIKHILELDPHGLFITVARERISMCGVAPTTMMLSAAIELGAQKTEIIEYTNSGKVSGDFDQVVAYLSMIVH